MSENGGNHPLFAYEFEDEPQPLPLYTPVDNQDDELSLGEPLELE